MGTVLFEAVTLHTPYDADNPYVLMKQMMERPVPRLRDVAEDVSQELSDLAEAMLARDPRDRLQDAGQALERLDTVPELSEDAGSKT